ncbi:hypothetical protein AOLI_G00297590 [Acnodon oligacanthus]
MSILFDCSTATVFLWRWLYSAAYRLEVAAPPLLYSALPANWKWLHHHGHTQLGAPAGTGSFITTILSFVRQLDLTAPPLSIAPPPQLYAALHTDRTRLPDQVLLTGTPTEFGCFTRLLTLLTDQPWPFHHSYSALSDD